MKINFDYVLLAVVGAGFLLLLKTENDVKNSANKLQGDLTDSANSLQNYIQGIPGKLWDFVTGSPNPNTDDPADNDVDLTGNEYDVPVNPSTIGNVDMVNLP